MKLILVRQYYHFGQDVSFSEPCPHLYNMGTETAYMGWEGPRRLVVEKLTRYLSAH